MQRITDRFYSWASVLDDRTREQVDMTSRMPFIYPHVALMPDAHLGKGCAVGTVLPTRGAIIPAAVGVDIGCGMIAVRTRYVAEELPRDRRPLREAIERTVPLSPGNYSRKIRDGRTAARVADLEAYADSEGLDPAGYARNWRLQLGSLGGGNHFIEVSLDEEDRVWLFLHSGSRGVGNKIATAHIAVALERCRRRSVDLPHPDLAYLEEDEPEFWAYVRGLQWAQRFALLNREEMMDRVADCFEAWVGGAVEETQRVNCFAGKTSVITRNGVERIDRLAAGTHELLTTAGEWVKAPVKAFGRQRLSKVTLSRSGVIKTLYATADHRWIVRSRREVESDVVTRDLQAGDRLAYAFPRRPQGVTVDRLAAARGVVFGDGTTRGDTRAVANSCGEKDKALLHLFEGVGHAPREYEYGNSVVRRINGLPVEWKTEMPSVGDEPSVIYGWLAGYFAADGDVDKTGRPTLSSATREHLERVRTLASQVGVGTYGIRERERVGYGSEPSSLYLLGFMRGDLDPEFFLLPEHHTRFEAGAQAAERRGWNVVSVEETGRVEEVYCAVVDGTHTFALEDNILTGNCHHNYTVQETVRGEDVWLSRKGAIDAHEGVPGLIPGSMGTRSYVVVGLGNELALNSSPHGAGRRYGRNQARRTFSHADLVAAMGGIEWSGSKAFVDEIPGAYKDIDQVMADASDLVAVRHTLRQIVNVKGT